MQQLPPPPPPPLASSRLPTSRPTDRPTDRRTRRWVGELSLRAADGRHSFWVAARYFVPIKIVRSHAADSHLYVDISTRYKSPLPLGSFSLGYRPCAPPLRPPPLASGRTDMHVSRWKGVGETKKEIVGKKEDIWGWGAAARGEGEGGRGGEERGGIRMF